MWTLASAGTRLARFLSRPRRAATQVATTTPGFLAAALRPGDVLLVEGNTRIAAAIKFLTQSTWSHAALYIGDALGPLEPGQEPGLLLEADLTEGVRAVPLSNYAAQHTRICRPVGLTEAEVDAVVRHALTRLGHRYDLKHIFDLARYLFPMPPVPSRYRRRLIALGSGDPTRAICSSIIAEAFQSVRYPILPEIVLADSDDPACAECYRELLHIRHHSLFTPRDFDVSPYFEIVKPTIRSGFDPHSLAWTTVAMP